ncbi:unnamed protein product [Somion occarium]
MAATSAVDDVFQENSPLIVDCDVLEAAKENIQPIAKGRRVTALSAILSTPHAQRETRLAATRNRLRINVEVSLEDEDDDPLEAYCRFVDWTVENYPQGHSAESGLLELLEEATRVLRNDRDGKWKDDMRYLKLWVLYASYVEKPAIIYKFCVVNEIGTSHALLYEEFAVALERAGRKAEADETYLLGVARRAAPVERLEAKHREFQKRMLTSTSLPVDTPPEVPASTSSGSRSRRTVLGETSSSRTRASSSRTEVPTHAPVPIEDDIPPRPNARMQVFVDPSGSADQNSSPAPWPELGTRKTRIKENVREVSKAAGSTLKQAGRTTRMASAGSGSKIPIFRDPDGSAAVDDMPPPPAPSSSSKSKPSASSGKLAVFRDEEPVPSTSMESKSDAPTKLSIFRDEKPVRTIVTRSKSAKLPVFNDSDAAPSTSSKRNTSATSKLTVFREDDLAPVSSTSKKDKATAPARLTIFRDGGPGADDEPVPATPKFTPYRDEGAPPTPSSHLAVPESVMKEKPAPSGTRGVKMSSEAEALRKDPLKNYDEEDRLVALD